MRKKLLSALMLMCLVAFLNLSCKKDDPVPAGPATVNVSILAMSYSPATLSVVKGTIVKWTNNGGTTHTVTSDNGTSFSSPILNAGDVFSVTTPVTGTFPLSFPYHCTVHGVTMSGTLTVTN